MMVAARSIAPSASVVRTALWDDVVVSAGAQLTECVVGDAAEIPAGARFQRCAIVPAAGRTPGPGEHLEGDLLIRPF
jgi:NDP-sugar pyrophosphorylase family protein